ncbi:T9SS type A sorting domain-containing protein [bacterium]|nr:T9SS type A sorting domain-containing protein [bacterium]MBU1636293.1 T9SS type A sorting domain-containing protein [bacterium]MBU1919714.1 T9SS type A sorting domain-containing protein [bacterium]
MKKTLTIVLAALLCSAVVVPVLAQPLPELIIYPWTLPQYFCIYLDAGMNMEVYIDGGPMPPNSPKFTITPGCDPAQTGCFDPNCMPIFAEFSTWTYDANTGRWHATLFYQSGELPGCVCICYDGWYYNGDCYFPYDEIDMGDLEGCNYGTQICNPSHGLSGIAWLGASVDGEWTPNILDLDLFDDGVVFHNLPWTPCDNASVTVRVTGGPNYLNYASAACQGQLFLNAWKDGNIDLDFCDEILCDDGTFVSEWVIQDEPVQPGDYTFSFRDPGIKNIGPYDLKMRFRLTSTPVGRNGHSWVDTTLCPEMPCGTFGHDMLGEVEDYIYEDMQLSVELQGFDAIAGDGMVTLNWSTASETDNAYFELRRDTELLTVVEGAGTSASESIYTFVDETAVNGTEYHYTLFSVSIGGSKELIGTASAVPLRSAGTATEYALFQNYPNPFNSRTNITFDLAENEFVSLRIFNLMGQEIATLVNHDLNAGRHEITFDAGELATGVYLYRLESENFTAQRKLVLIK